MMNEEEHVTQNDHTQRRTRCRASVLVLMMLGGLPGPVSAQAPTPPPPEREGSAEFAFVGTTGNSSTQTIGVGGEYIYRPSPWEARLKVSYVRNEAEDQLRAQAFLFTARAQRLLRPRLSGYGQYGYQRDRFAGILDRNTIEGGVLLLVDRTGAAEIDRRRGSRLCQ